MKREPLVRITAREFDEARIDLLRELTGVDPALPEEPPALARTETRNDQLAAKPWASLIRTLALK